MFKTRRLLVEQLSEAFLNQTVDDFDSLVEWVAAVLPASVQPSALEASLHSWAGVLMTADAIATLAHRLAGNLHRLKAGKSVHAWVVQRHREWVPAQIMAVHREPLAGEKGVTLTFRIMAGTSCTMQVTKWRSLRWMFHYAKHMGFSRRSTSGRTSGLPYQVPEQYVTLRLALLIEPALSKQQPDFHYVDVTSTMRAWNRAQLRRRLRLDTTFKCREGYASDVPCHRCWRGYTSCPAGTHRLDYVFKTCAGCNTAEAAFDLDIDKELCIVCSYAKQHRKER